MIRELRGFTRRRKQMIGLAAPERNHVQKILEDGNVKIGGVLSDVFGLSGQLMLEALVAGKRALPILRNWRSAARAKRLPNSRRRWKDIRCASRTAR